MPDNNEERKIREHMSALIISTSTKYRLLLAYKNTFKNTGDM